MGDFVFYSASQAYYCEIREAFPLKGVEKYGGLFHKYNIPMTWMTNTEGAKRGKEIFTEFHGKYGDQVIVWCRPHHGNTSYMRENALAMGKEEIKKYILKEQKGVKKHLPFAKTDHIGYFYRTLPAVRAMKELEVKSVYGHCWEMIETDGVTDCGVPWGLYYLDTEKTWKRPSQNPRMLRAEHLKQQRKKRAGKKGTLNRKKAKKSGIVANEWLQHDINKSWNYYGSCSVFSFDPNDVERAKICDGRSIGYWKKAFREYYRNRNWNSFIPFVFHQEAHEQESTPGGWEVYPPETVQNTYEMTDEFLKFITSSEFPDLQIMTLPEAIKVYRKKFSYTNPTYMLYKDIEIDMPIWKKRKEKVWNIYQEAKEAEQSEGETLDPEKDYRKFSYLNFPYGWQGMVHEDEAPFPKSFVYCDHQTQLFFHKGKSSPMKAYNYLKKIKTKSRNLYHNEHLLLEDNLPEVSISPQNYMDLSLDKLDEIKILINAKKEIPFGLCIWGNYPVNSWEIEFDLSSFDALDLIEIKDIGDTLTFLRFNILRKGKISVSLIKSKD